MNQNAGIGFAQPRKPRNQPRDSGETAARPGGPPWLRRSQARNPHSPPEPLQQPFSPPEESVTFAWVKAVVEDAPSKPGDVCMHPPSKLLRSVVAGILVLVAFAGPTNAGPIGQGFADVCDVEFPP